jgi:zinc/manganese transport system substrate-binding protein
MRMRTGWVAVTAVVVAVGAAGCSQQGSTQNADQAATIVASTDVWGSVAGAVAGDHASVTSILDSAVDDPHS